MRDQIDKLIHAQPFEPFALEVAEDLAYSIPTRDHVLLGKEHIAVLDDQGYMDIVGISHIRRLRVREVA